MREFWDKYKLVVIIAMAVILLFTGTSAYYRHKVSTLKQQLFDKEIEHVIEVDKLMSDIIRDQVRRADSLLQIEHARYDSLLIIYNKEKKTYEKVLTDYSDIVIDRPEY